MTLVSQDMKKKLDASEREKEELLKQKNELQAELKEQQGVRMQAETESAKLAGLIDQIESLKGERAELKAQVSQFRSEIARLDSDNRAAVAETTRLKAANTSLQQQQTRLEQEVSIARDSLAQEHAEDMARHSTNSEQELAELTEQWKKDVATRDARIASTEAIAADLQSLLSESHTRSETLEAQAQELVAESEEMMAALKVTHRAETSQLQSSLEDSLLVRQNLEERIASGESEAAMLRSAAEETRRQLEVASMERQWEEESWALKQKEFDAKIDREARRSAALEKRIESLQKEVMDLGKPAAGEKGLSSAARQVTWYSEQLEISQNNARRLQRETDRVVRENQVLEEQLSDAKAEAKSLRAEAREAKDSIRRLRHEQQFPSTAGADATSSISRCARCLCPLCLRYLTFCRRVDTHKGARHQPRCVAQHVFLRTCLTDQVIIVEQWSKHSNDDRSERSWDGWCRTRKPGAECKSTTRNGALTCSPCIDARTSSGSARLGSPWRASRECSTAQKK